MRDKEFSESPLTGREKQVLKMLADGYSNEEIGEMLKLSRRTVEAHRARMMLKLDIHGLAGLVKYAIRTGLTSIDYHKKE